MTKCGRSLCHICPYPYCIEDEPWKERERIIEAAREAKRQERREKSPLQRKRESWRRWYQRNREKERERGLANHRKRKEGNVR